MEIVKTLLTGLTVAAVSVPAVQAQTRANPQVEQRTERIQVPRAGRVSMIGVRLADVTSDEAKTLKLPRAEGAMVESVNPNSPATRATIKKTRDQRSTATLLAGAGSAPGSRAVGCMGTAGGADGLNGGGVSMNCGGWRTRFPTAG